MERKENSEEQSPDLGFYKVYRHLTGQFTPDVVVFLSYLIDKHRYYKSKKELLQEKWFYVRWKDVEREIKLTAHKARKCKVLLESEGIIETKMMTHPQKQFYSINWNATVNDQSLKNLTINRQNTLRYNKTKNNNYLVDKENIVSKEKEKQCSIYFDKFWYVYPNKIGKKDTRLKWDELYASNKLPEFKDLIQALLDQKKSERWKNKKYIPNPVNWLKKEKWLDDPKALIDYSLPNGVCPNIDLGWEFGKSWNPKKTGCINCEEEDAKLYNSCRIIILKNNRN